jgi:hypothetical protein
MKAIIPFFITLFSSLLIAYGFFSIIVQHTDFSYRIGVTIIAFAHSFLALSTAFVVSYETKRISTVIAYTGSAYFVLGLISCIILALFMLSINWFILLVGLFSMVYLSAIYFISKSEQ